MPRKSSKTIDRQLDEEELLSVQGFKCRKKKAKEKRLKTKTDLILPQN